jgi:MFS family permease
MSKRFSRNVISLGWVSFCTDLASEMLYPVMPLFLVGTLGASPALLGVIDGIAEGGSSVLRWLAGAISDRFRRRKPFVVAGYGISALSKPVMGLAAFALGWPLFLIGRSMDRLGKSIRTSARDALIADSTAVEHRGAAFGLHRAMDTAGAVCGPLAAVAIRTWRPDFPLAWLFFIALGPGVVSALLALLAVKDIPHEPGAGKPPALFQKFPRPFWHVLIAAGVFAIANSSDTFLILRAKELGMGFRTVVLAYAAYNVIYAAASLPAGGLSDRIPRKWIVAAGWVVYAIVYVGFGFVSTKTAVWPLMLTYGLYQALTDGVTKALITDVVGKEQRAGAIGLFYTVAGIGQLAASVLAGVMWKVRIVHGALRAPFAIGAGCSLLAAVILVAARPAGAPRPSGAQT